MKLEELQKELPSIGWEIRGRYPNAWIFDNKGHRTNMRVMGDRIEVERVFEESFTGSVCFYFDGSTLTKIEDDTISIGTEKCFINLYGKGV